MKTFEEFLAEAAAPDAPAAAHLRLSKFHEDESKKHEFTAKSIRSDMVGADYAKSVIYGDCAKWHEHAAKVHNDASRAYLSGATGAAQINARSAKQASATANAKWKLK